MPRRQPQPLPTIWRAPDDLWRVIEMVLCARNPPKRTGRKRHDGKHLVRGRAIEVLEGDWQARWPIVVEFTGVERDRAWYASPEYREIPTIRQRHARTELIVVQRIGP